MGRWVTLEESDQHVYINDKGEVLPRGPGTKPTHKYKGARSEAERSKTAALVAKTRAKRAGKPTLREQADKARAAKGSKADRMERALDKVVARNESIKQREGPAGVSRNISRAIGATKPPTPTLREQAAVARAAKGTRSQRLFAIAGKSNAEQRAIGDRITKDTPVPGRYKASENKRRESVVGPLKVRAAIVSERHSRIVAEQMTAAKPLHEHAQEAANAVPASKRFGDKAFLSDVHHEYQKTGGKLGLAEFKQKLADSPEARVKLGLSRNDLNAREDHAKTQASEAQVKSGGRVLAEYHFVTTTARPKRSK